MADIIICPHCEKEVLIPEKNLKQFPCPECLQAVNPPPEPLTKRWVIFASLSGVLVLIIFVIVPIVTGLILDKIEAKHQNMEANFQSKKSAIEREISELRSREAEENNKENARKKAFEEEKKTWENNSPE
ncbi:MAG: hypothetical protein IKB16_03530 [Lentisphaeria bacterium]|nr:hypothetical protein [Lentisphaeria bacterium]